MQKITYNYLQGIIFHSDIDRFLYYADSPLKNYEYNDIFKQLKIQVVSGNIDSGYNIYCNEEPSVLYTTYKVIQPKGKTTKIPHYPRYRALTPEQRYEYLKVLINPYGPAKEGYLYLLLYCLERRLSEGNEEVIPIMIKLAECHQGKFYISVKEMLRKYNLLKEGCRFPQNAKVYNNYTLFDCCYDWKL